MEISPSHVIQRNADLLATQVDGETVLMDVGSGKYFGIAKTAQAIWAHLESPLTFQSLCERLQDQFAGPADAIASDTERFVLQLAKERLVTLS